MIKENGTFPEGLIHNSVVHKKYDLASETFAHTLGLLADVSVETAKLEDDAYYRACLFAQRLSVSGIDKITPEMILGLSGADGRALLNTNNTLENRRQEFRNEIKANPKNDGSDVQTGD